MKGNPMASDGKPIKIGEHMWDERGDEVVVCEVSGEGLVWCKYTDLSGGGVADGSWRPSQLTHEPRGDAS